MPRTAAWGLVSPERIRIGIPASQGSSAPPSRMAVTSSSPLMPGRPTSMTAASGWPPDRSFTASSPEGASSGAKRSAVRFSDRKARVGASSSTSSTEGTAPPTPSGIPPPPPRRPRAGMAPRCAPLRGARRRALAPWGGAGRPLEAGKSPSGGQQACEPLEPRALAGDEVVGGEPQRLQVGRARVVEGAGGAEGERGLQARVALAEGQAQRVAHQLGAGGRRDGGRVVVVGRLGRRAEAGAERDQLHLLPAP